MSAVSKEERQDRSPILPAHIEDTVHAIAEVHRKHRRDAGPMQRGVDAMTALVGRPAFTLVLTGILTTWIGLNLAMPMFRLRPFDPPPFAYLSGLTAVTALYIAGLILATQRREDELTSQREQLTLEISIITEQKIAKLIELVERLRQDSPDLADRVDEEATAMTKSADPQAVLDAILQSHTFREEAASAQDHDHPSL